MYLGWTDTSGGLTGTMHLGWTDTSGGLTGTMHLGGLTHEVDWLGQCTWGGLRQCTWGGLAGTDIAPVIPAPLKALVDEPPMNVRVFLSWCKLFVSVFSTHRTQAH